MKAQYQFVLNFFFKFLGDYSIRFSISDPSKHKVYACLDLKTHLTFHH